tara:strand:+ start:1453 stop:1959 length:507 start_codon:yes stop_codon:yes gene_type:complete
MFDINFSLFGRELTPWFWRSPRWKQWIGVCLWGLQIVNDLFVSFRQTTAFNLGFNGQKIYLEKWLNLTFDATNQTYQIINRPALDTPAIWNKAEQVGNHIFNKSESSADRLYLFNKSERTGGFDFIVYVPAPLVLTPALIAAIRFQVDKFVIAGKNYDVTQTINPWGY